MVMLSAVALEKFCCLPFADVSNQTVFAVFYQGNYLDLMILGIFALKSSFSQVSAVGKFCIQTRLCFVRIQLFTDLINLISSHLQAE